jgi:hypothetical protein
MSHSNSIVWIHGDCLSPTNPALSAYPDAPAVFVWDDALLQDYALSLKRIVFMYECLLEMPVTIRRGDVAQEVARFAYAHGASHIVTTATPAPRFADIVKGLRGQHTVEIKPVEPFLNYGGRLDLRRFSRYWRTAQKQLLR